MLKGLCVLFRPRNTGRCKIDTGGSRQSRERKQLPLLIEDLEAISHKAAREEARGKWGQGEVNSHTLSREEVVFVFSVRARSPSTLITFSCDQIAP